MTDKAKNLLILGADGQLGSDIRLLLESHDLRCPTERELDITSRESCHKYCSRTELDCVINCAAFTDVPGCETALDRAREVNALGPKYLAEACAENRILLVQISTDYVFDGRKGSPYVESDVPSPINAYGMTKLEGEDFVRSTCPDHIILRTSGLYGKNPCLGKGGKNFVQTMLQLAREGKPIRVVNDEFVSPTYTLEVARLVPRLLGTEIRGIVHAACQGVCSWYEFAKAIFEISALDPELRPISVSDLQSGVARPPFSALRNQTLEEIDLNIMKTWRGALEEYLKNPV